MSQFIFLLIFLCSSPLVNAENASDDIEPFIDSIRKNGLSVAQTPPRPAVWNIYAGAAVMQTRAYLQATEQAMSGGFPEISITLARSLYEHTWIGGFAAQGALGISVTEPLNYFSSPSFNTMSFGVPLTAALKYQVIFMKYLIPHTSIGPTLMIMRNTSVGSHTIQADLGYTFTAGVDLALSWSSNITGQPLYTKYKIHNSYIFAEYRTSSSFKLFSTEYSFSSFLLGLKFSF